MSMDKKVESELKRLQKILSEANEAVPPPARTGMHKLKQKFRRSGLGSKLKNAAIAGAVGLGLAGGAYGVSKALETSPEELQQIAYNYAQKNADKFEGHSTEEIAKAISNLPEWARDLEGEELDTEISRQLGDIEPLPSGEEPTIRESKLHVSVSKVDRMINEELSHLKKKVNESPESIEDLEKQLKYASSDQVGKIRAKINKLKGYKTSERDYSNQSRGVGKYDKVMGKFIPDDEEFV